jgi:spore coat protein CotF
MNDKEILEDILLNVKGACDLCLHATVESSTPNIHCTFDSALNDTLKMQNDIYTKMSQKGWYPSEQEQQQKIDAVKQKFSNQ